MVSIEKRLYIYFIGVSIWYIGFLFVFFFFSILSFMSLSEYYNLSEDF